MTYRPERLIGMAEVARRTGLTEAQVDDLGADAPPFPPGVVLAGERRWREADIDAWIRRLSAPKKPGVPHFDDDAAAEPVAAYLAGRTETTLMEVAQGALGYEAAQFGTQAANRIAAVLTSLGWRRGRRTKDRRPWVAPKPLNP